MPLGSIPMMLYLSVRRTTVISRLIAHGRLKFMGQKTGVGIYTEKPFVHITHTHTDHRIKKTGVGAYTEMGAYSGEYGTCNSS